MTDQRTNGPTGQRTFSFQLFIPLLIPALKNLFSFLGGPLKSPGLFKSPSVTDGQTDGRAEGRADVASFAVIMSLLKRVSRMDVAASEVEAEAQCKQITIENEMFCSLRKDVLRLFRRGHEQK